MPIKNLLQCDLTGPQADERFEELLCAEGFRLERIISTGQTTVAGTWFDQDCAEWILLLAGSARLRLEHETEQIALKPGDSLCIPAHCRHRVEWTDPSAPTIWLALHFSPQVVSEK